MRRLQTFLTVSFSMTATALAVPVSAWKISPTWRPSADKLLRKGMLAAVGTLVFLSLPLVAQAQLYQGVETYDQTGGSAALAFDLNMNPRGGPITGYFGNGQLGTNPPAVTRLRGTKTGNHCTVTLEVGGVTFDGTCDDHSFSGTFRVGDQTGRFAVYTWSGANCTSPDLTNSTSSTTPESNSSPEITPQPTPQPKTTPNGRPQPRPKPTPETIEPAQPIKEPVKYCGTAHNETYNSNIQLEIDLDEENSFTGAVMIVGGSNRRDLETFGGGEINGSFNRANCSGTTKGGTQFHGTCTDTTITASYTVGSQKGTFTVTKGACDTTPQAKVTPEPRPQPNPQPPLQPAPKPMPKPTGPVKYCGTFHNETYNSTGPLEIDFTTAGSFNGAVMKVGAARENTLSTYGGGKMNGTFDTTNCSGATEGGLQFHGTCTDNKITASYTVAGQKGTFTLAKGCP
jgi:hypothetical protein